MPRITGSEHQPQDLETHGKVGWFRVPCTCGWIGGWWPEKDKARKSHERHVRREAPDSGVAQMRAVDAEERWVRDGEET